MYTGWYRTEKPVKIYINGEFFCKSEFPDSVVDLELAGQFNIVDVTVNEKGDVLVSTSDDNE